MYNLNIVYLVQHRAVIVVRTMGHMRDVLHLDVSTVFPHYAGALDDGTAADERDRVFRASAPAPEDDTTRR